MKIELVARPDHDRDRRRKDQDREFGGSSLGFCQGPGRGSVPHLLLIGGLGQDFAAAAVARLHPANRRAGVSAVLPVGNQKCGPTHHCRSDRREDPLLLQVVQPVDGRMSGPDLAHVPPKVRPRLHTNPAIRAIGRSPGQGTNETLFLVFFV